jgi:glycosyltransferase involved in cell wall biosynthesis
MNRSTINYYPLLLKAVPAALQSTTALQLETGTLELPHVNAHPATTPEMAQTWRSTRYRRETSSWRVTLFISNLANDGGAEVQSISLARALKSRGWDVSVISMRSPKAGVDLLRSSGITVHTLDASGGNPVRPMLRLARLLRELRPHVLHCHMSHAVLTARLTRLFCRVPVVIATLHGLKMYNVRGTGWRLRETANGLTEWLSDVTTVVCRAAANHYISTGAASPSALRLVPNGVDTDRFRFDPAVRQRLRTELGVANEFVWLMVGRFQLVKDHHTMLRVFARVAAESPRSVLLLAGSGPLQGELAELAKGLGIGSRVRFLGTRSDIPELMNAADACVLSSIYEAMPMTLLEAAASGLPAVATDVGGTSDIVVHGVTGFLAPPSNPEALASAMLRLSSLPAASRSRMGEHARRHVASRYAMETVVEQWESLYQEMLAKKEVRR